MEIEKVSVKLNAFKSMVEAAREHFDMGEYDKSMQIYFTAAKEAVQLYGKASAEEAQCLRGMADAFYKLDRFIEAKSVLLQLVEIDDKLGQEKSEDAIAARFKLARSFESLQEYDESLAQFKKVAAVAEKELLLGHPLVTTILEAFAHMLRRARKDPKLLTQIEEKARVSRKKYADPENANKNLTENIIEDLKNEEKERLKPVWAPKERISQNSIFYRTSEGARRVIEFAKNHPRIFRLILLSPFVIALITLAFSVTTTVLETKGIIATPPMAAAAPDRLYKSFDGTETIKFHPAYKATVSLPIGKRDVPVRCARPGWSELLILMFFSKPDQAWLVADADTLTNEATGATLFNATKASGGLLKKLNTIGIVTADAITDRLPMNSTTIEEGCQQAHLTDSDGKPLAVQFLSSSSAGVYKDPRVKIARGIYINQNKLSPNSFVVFEELNLRPNSDNDNRDSDGDIINHTNNVNTDNNLPATVDGTRNERIKQQQQQRISFNPTYIVFATDENGLPYHQGDVPIRAEVIDGVLHYATASSKTVFPALPSQVVVATATPTYIASVYMQLLGLLLWAALHFSLTVIVIKSSGLKGTRQSAQLEEEITSQSLMYLAWSVFTFAMFGYGVYVFHGVIH